MKIETAVEVLKSFDKKDIDNIVDVLNDKHMVSDEDDTALSSYIMKIWSHECYVYLKENGYRGGDLRIIGKYFPNYGASYLLYDKINLTFEEAYDYLISETMKSIKSMEE
jgi:hypothetical protein